ncbi:ABC transporter ATP-binding protein [Fodinisporobacter ferrooxydans]|uniref:ABC transporter ATP-binding protein n=1 Tax=Fodinisporobacter ferrooxydans TaxID=2901836 RepID=A0ABY4CQ77_9BACL|nr:ABC transporter ATP-binding protein [Alicyclobacillaceae bacterium MYW30-H2]
MLDVKNLSWIREQKPILDDIQWQIKEHEHWALVGLNGSGKTSLLKMITGYEWPTRGKIQVLGNTFGECEIQHVRKSIGWVSSAIREQIYPSDSVLEVVVSGKYASIGIWTKPEHGDYEQAHQILEHMNCQTLAKSRYGVLSQGEKQKVLLARAQMAQPHLLILDEPCFGLDLRAREQFLQVLQTMGQDQSMSIILVTHHIEEILPVFTHVALIANGKFVASGPKREILTEQHLRDTFQVDVKLEWNNDRPWIQIVNRS